MKISRTKVLVAIFAIIIAILYLPTILYGARLFGLQLVTPILNGKKIDMGPWWIPISAPGSVLQNVFDRASSERLVFVKAGGWLPGIKDKLVISKTKSKLAPETWQTWTVLKVEWGEPLEVPRASSEPFFHAYVRDGDLLITLSELSVLHEIRQIH